MSTSDSPRTVNTATHYPPEADGTMVVVSSPAPSRRRWGSTADLVRSLGIVLVLVAVVVLLVARHDSNRGPVDAAPLLVAANSDAGFAVVDPSGAPDGWTLTSARYVPTSSETGAQWHLG